MKESSLFSMPHLTHLVLSELHLIFCHQLVLPKDLQKMYSLLTRIVWWGWKKPLLTNVSTVSSISASKSSRRKE